MTGAAAAAAGALRILWLATKPPWPPADGGRLVAALTIETLAQRGHAVTVVAPSRGPFTAPAPRIETTPLPPPRGRALALLASLVTAQPYSMHRHRSPALARAVARLAPGDFDLVHAEQLQALASWPAHPGARLPPVVVRMQNVESDLFAQAAPQARGLARLWLARQAGRLARVEQRALAGAAGVCALSAADADRLAGSAGRPVSLTPPPFPARLPDAGVDWPGNPPLVLFCSSWLPNRDGARWFARDLWPGVHERYPQARLHWLGAGPAARPPGGMVTVHPAPADSRQGFPANGVHLVPLRIASGVRMRILEAFARGVPVVATAAAARGLAVEADRHFLLADDAREVVRALGELARPGRRADLVAAGRAFLVRHHHPDLVIDQLLAVYRAAIADGNDPRGGIGSESR